MDVEEAICLWLLYRRLKQRCIRADRRSRKRQCKRLQRAAASVAGLDPGAMSLSAAVGPLDSAPEFCDVDKAAQLPPDYPVDTSEAAPEMDSTEEWIIKEKVEDLADFGNDFYDEKETLLGSGPAQVEIPNFSALSQQPPLSQPSSLSQHPPQIKVVSKQSQGKDQTLLYVEPLIKKVPPRPQRRRPLDTTPVDKKQKQQKQNASTSSNGEHSQLWSIAKCQEDILKILQKQLENRDDHFDNFARYVASLLKALPKDRACALQPKIIELITAEHMSLDPGAGTSK